MLIRGSVFRIIHFIIPQNWEIRWRYMLFKGHLLYGFHPVYRWIMSGISVLLSVGNNMTNTAIGTMMPSVLKSMHISIWVLCCAGSVSGGSCVCCSSGSAAVCSGRICRRGISGGAGICRACTSCCGNSHCCSCNSCENLSDLHVTFLLICPFYVGMRFWTLALLGFRSLKLPAHTLIIAHILLKCNFSLQ